MASETHGNATPAGELLTRLQLAARVKCNPRTVGKLIEEGLPIAVRGRGGRPSLYNIDDVVAWMTAREATSKSPDSLDLVAERARKEHWQAQLAEQQFQVRAGRLIPAEDVERVWSRHVAAVRSKLLALPTSLSDRLHRVGSLEGAQGIEAALQVAIYDVLRELSAGVSKGQPAGRDKKKSISRQKNQRKKLTHE